MNCLIAQSGGPTTVINASIVGIIKGNQSRKCYDTVYGGLNGMEGILTKDIINLSKLTDDEIERLKYTPSSSLGSCRYKLKAFEDDEQDYIRFFNILNDLSIDTFFYIGGNDSMDTVHKLSHYAKLQKMNKKIIGIPKTIDNDLHMTDHTPGYGSAARFIVTTVMETYMDANVYKKNGIFILETMGRDTGWLAASSAVAQIDGKPIVDYVFLPESPLVKEKFIEDMKETYRNNGQVYIVVSEGVKDESGEYLYNINSQNKHDTFSHPQLGGVGKQLEKWIIEAGITNRIKVLELGILQRCSMHLVSGRDLDEAVLVGAEAVSYAQQNYSGIMVAIKRLNNYPYKVETVPVDVSKVCNRVKYFPAQWIENGNQITKKAIDYIEPLLDNSTTDSKKNITNFIQLTKKYNIKEAL